MLRFSLADCGYGHVLRLVCVEKGHTAAAGLQLHCSQFNCLLIEIIKLYQGQGFWGFATREPSRILPVH